MRNLTRSLRSVPRLAACLVAVACARSPADVTVIIEGTDFAFAAPDTLSPGPTRFRFQRSGTVAHEMAIARVKAGTTLATALKTEAAGGAVEGLYDEGDGLLYADVGETIEAELLVNLEPGRQYVLACTLETNGKVHTTLGMVKGIVVRAR